MIKHTHELNCHRVPDQTGNSLMEYYWILGCRVVVKRTIIHCVLCRGMIRDVRIPKMADLPHKKLLKIINLSSKQLDFIEPFPVKNSGKLFSLYVLLLKCLVVGAVHLEVSNDISTASTINCISRFIGRKGKPTKSFQTGANHLSHPPVASGLALPS